MNPFIQVKTTASLFFTTVCLLCLWLLPTAQAISPAPDGCYPNFTTAEGCHVLNFLTTGAANTGLGWHALFSASTGAFNTAVGGGALVLNNADSNAAVGAAALLLNTTGTTNTAVGTSAMVHYSVANNNAALGAFALSQNDTDDNTAVGFEALQLSVSSVTNVAVGTFAAQNNDSSGTGAAEFNVAVGGFAPQANVDGARNTAVGAGAMQGGSGGSDNTAVGEVAGNGTTGNFNTALGSGTGQGVAGGEGNIYIGAHVQPVTSDEFEFIRIGNDTAFTFPYDTYIAGIFNRSNDPATATVCYVDSTGKVASILSSRRYKHDIKPMESASEAILALKPMSFHYNSDAKNTPCFGLIAEEVAAVNPDLVIRDKKGEVMTVRYDVVWNMLLNEFLKEHKKVEEQHASISQLRSEMQTMVAQLKDQAAQIQKVSAQLEVSKPAPQVVANKP